MKYIPYIVLVLFVSLSLVSFLNYQIENGAAVLTDNKASILDTVLSWFGLVDLSKSFAEQKCVTFPAFTNPISGETIPEQTICEQVLPHDSAPPEPVLGGSVPTCTVTASCGCVNAFNQCVDSIPACKDSPGDFCSPAGGGTPIHREPTPTPTPLPSDTPTPEQGRDACQGIPANTVAYRACVNAIERCEDYVAGGRNYSPPAGTCNLVGGCRTAVVGGICLDAVSEYCLQSNDPSCPTDIAKSYCRSHPTTNVNDPAQDCAAIYCRQNPKACDDYLDNWCSSSAHRNSTFCKNLKQSTGGGSRGNATDGNKVLSENCNGMTARSNPNGYAECLRFQSRDEGLCFSGNANGSGGKLNGEPGQPCTCEFNPTWNAGNSFCWTSGYGSQIHCDAGEFISQPLPDLQQCVDANGNVKKEKKLQPRGSADDSTGGFTGGFTGDGGRFVINTTTTRPPTTTTTRPPVITGPMPRISSFSPLFAKVGDVVTIKGTKFSAGSCPTNIRSPELNTKVLVGDEEVQADSYSSNTLRFKIPDFSSGEAYKLRVVSGGCATKAGRTSDFSSRLLTVVDSSQDPTIYYIVPLQIKPGRTYPVTVYGTNIAKVTTIDSESEGVEVDQDSIKTSLLSGKRTKIRFNLSLSSATSPGIHYLNLDDEAGNSIRFELLVSR